MVIGGGYAGVTCAKMLEENGNFEVTLVDRKSYFEYHMGVSGIIQEPDQVQKHRVKYSDILKESTVIQDEVSMVTDTEVVLREFGSYQLSYFDYIVVATGMVYDKQGLNQQSSHPSAKMIVVNGMSIGELSTHAKFISEAQRITVYGSEGVAIELVGTLAKKYKTATITLLSPSAKLISQYCAGAHDKIVHYFNSKKNISLIFDEKIRRIVDKSIITIKGKTIQSDLLIMCYNFKPNTFFLLNKTCSYYYDAMSVRRSSRICNNLVNVIFANSKEENSESNNDITVIDNFENMRELTESELKLCDISHPLVLLQQSIERGDNHIVKHLLLKGTSCNEIDRKQNKTFLMIALENQNIQIIDLMVKHGNASLTFSDRNGDTALHFVCSRGLLSMVKLLLEKYQSPFDMLNSNGETAFMCSLSHASSTQYFISKVSSILNRENLEQFISIADKSNGSTVIHRAVLENRVESLLAIISSIPEILLPRVLNAKDNHGFTPIHLAVKQNVCILMMFL